MAQNICQAAKTSTHYVLCSRRYRGGIYSSVQSKVCNTNMHVTCRTLGLPSQVGNSWVQALKAGSEQKPCSSHMGPTLAYKKIVTWTCLDITFGSIMLARTLACKTSYS